MKKYRITYKVIRKNGTLGLRSTIHESTSFIDVLTEFYLLAMREGIETEILQVMYIPDGIEA